MKPETDENATSIARRADNENEQRVLTHLKDNPQATLHRPPKLDAYWIHDGVDYVGGTRLSAGRVQRLETAGVLKHVGTFRYAMAGKEKAR